MANMQEYAPYQNAVTSSPVTAANILSQADQTQSWLDGGGYQLDPSAGGYNVNQNASISSPYNTISVDPISGDLMSSIGSGASTAGGLLSVGGDELDSDAGPVASMTGGLASGGVSALGGAGAAAMGVGTAIGIYNNAPADSTGGFIEGAASGAATGAEIGSIVPGIGTVVGAVAGGIIGGIIGLFGSSSKKKAEEKAFQQQEQLAIAPAQQQEQNYLQNQGLLQQAVGNYSQFANPKGAAFGTAGTGSVTNPINFQGISPKNVITGAGGNGTNFGVTTPSVPNSGATSAATPNSGMKGLVAAQQQAGMIPSQTPSTTNTSGLASPSTGYNPYAAGAGPNYSGTQVASPYQAPANLTANAPAWTGNNATDQANLAAYKQQYAAMLAQQNQQGQAAAIDPYSQFFGGNS